MSETISRSAFDARLEAGSLALTLVGMSNVGKSFWSRRLQDETGFIGIGCDDQIETALGTALQDAGYDGGITDMARWMGQPYDPQFAANQQTYLDLESGVMQQTIDHLADSRTMGNTVIDTTGSVVHTNPALQAGIAEHSTVVYLEATADMQQQMFEKYMEEPKPVVWGSLYERKAGESTRQSLAASYPRLLEFRSRLYGRMSHVSIPHQVAVDLPDAPSFLAYVRGRLPAA